MQPHLHRQKCRDTHCNLDLVPDLMPRHMEKSKGAEHFTRPRYFQQSKSIDTLCKILMRFAVCALSVVMSWISIPGHRNPPSPRRAERTQLQATSSQTKRAVMAWDELPMDASMDCRYAGAGVHAHALRRLFALAGKFHLRSGWQRRCYNSDFRCKKYVKSALQLDATEKAGGRAKVEIERIVDLLQIHPRDDVVNSAQRLFMLALSHNFTKGRRTAQVRARARFYPAILQHAFP